jgi:hypothetical protein
MMLIKKMLKKNMQSFANPFPIFLPNLGQSLPVLPPQLLTNLFYRQKTARANTASGEHVLSILCGKKALNPATRENTHEPNSTFRRQTTAQVTRHARAGVC